MSILFRHLDEAFHAGPRVVIAGNSGGRGSPQWQRIFMAWRLGAERDGLKTEAKRSEGTLKLAFGLGFGILEIDLFGGAKASRAASAFGFGLWGDKVHFFKLA